MYFRIIALASAIASCLCFYPFIDATSVGERQTTNDERPPILFTISFWCWFSSIKHPYYRGIAYLPAYLSSQLHTYGMFCAPKVRCAMFQTPTHNQNLTYHTQFLWKHNGCASLSLLPPLSIFLLLDSWHDTMTVSVFNTNRKGAVAQSLCLFIFFSLSQFLSISLRSFAKFFLNTHTSMQTIVMVSIYLTYDGRNRSCEQNWKVTWYKTAVARKPQWQTDGSFSGRVLFSELSTVFPQFGLARRIL